MLKRISTLLGIGLIVLWIVGLGSPSSNGWLTWLDGVAALCAFGIAAFIPLDAKKEVKAGFPLALAIVLFTLWMVGLSSLAERWLVGCNFIFACAFLALGISEIIRKKPPTDYKSEIHKAA